MNKKVVFSQFWECKCTGLLPYYQIVSLLVALEKAPCNRHALKEVLEDLCEQAVDFQNYTSLFAWLMYR